LGEGDNHDDVGAFNAKPSASAAEYAYAINEDAKNLYAYMDPKNLDAVYATMTSVGNHVAAIYTDRVPIELVEETLNIYRMLRKLYRSLSNIPEAKPYLGFWEYVDLDSLPDEDREFRGRFRKSLADALVPKKQIKERMEDVQGLAEAKDALISAVQVPLLGSFLFQHVEPWKAILLYGPPGTGKTFLAKAIAGSTQVNLLSISAGSLKSKFIGQEEQSVQELFKFVKRATPCILFIDEIDSLLKTRSGGGSSNSSTLQEFLVQVDGIVADSEDASNNYLILAATNVPDDIDPAALRRFEQKIYIPLPDYEARRGLFVRGLKKVVHNVSRKTFTWMAKRTEGFSGSDIAHILKAIKMIPTQRITHANHFDVTAGRQLIRNDVFQQGFYPATPKNKHSVKVSWQHLPAHTLLQPSITNEMCRRVVAKAQTSVAPEDLEIFEKFKRKYDPVSLLKTKN
jgi:vacuolar protein-sorting-associated protein 4